MKAPKALEGIADVVLAYRPKPKSKAAKKRKRKEAQRKATNALNAFLPTERSMNQTAKASRLTLSTPRTRICGIVRELTGKIADSVANRNGALSTRFTA